MQSILEAHYKSIETQLKERCFVGDELLLSGNYAELDAAAGYTWQYVTKYKAFSSEEEAITYSAEVPTLDKAGTYSISVEAVYTEGEESAACELVDKLVAFGGPMASVVAMCGIVMLTTLLMVSIVYLIDSIELLREYYAGNEAAGEELELQAAMNVAFCLAFSVGTNAATKTTANYLIKTLGREVGEDACAKLVSKLGARNGLKLIKLLKKSGMGVDDIVKLVLNVSDDGLQTLFACASRKMPAEMLLYLCKHYNLLDNYADDVLRMLGNSSYGPDKIFGFLDKYKDDFVQVYRRHGDDAIVTLNKHADKLFNLPESYRHKAIDLVIRYGDDIMDGISKYTDDFMKRYDEDGEEFIKEYLEKKDEIFESGTKPEDGIDTIPLQIETRLDELVSEIRQDIGNDYPIGNVGAAVTDISGVTKELRAYSKYNNATSTPNVNHDYSYDLGKGNRIFDTKSVNSDNIVDGPKAFNRSVDSEAKILEDIAHQLGYNEFCVDETIKGNVYLITERIPCPSCEYVIEQFRQMFPNVKVFVKNKY